MFTSKDENDAQAQQNYEQLDAINEDIQIDSIGNAGASLSRDVSDLSKPSKMITTTRPTLLS